MNAFEDRRMAKIVLVSSFTAGNMLMGFGAMLTAAAGSIQMAALFLVVRGWLDSELAGLVGIEPSFLPWYVVLGMIATGMILGIFAALLGLRRLVTL